MNIRETYESIIAKAAEDAYNNGYQRGYDAGYLAGQTAALVSVYSVSEYSATFARPSQTSTISGSVEWKSAGLSEPT